MPCNPWEKIAESPRSAIRGLRENWSSPRSPCLSAPLLMCPSAPCLPVMVALYICPAETTHRMIAARACCF